jgi:hypothetical protein
MRIAFFQSKKEVRFLRVGLQVFRRKYRKVYSVGVCFPISVGFLFSLHWVRLEITCYDLWIISYPFYNVIAISLYDLLVEFRRSIMNLMLIQLMLPMLSNFGYG